MSDLRLKILDDIRDDIRELRKDIDTTNANARFEAIDTSLHNMKQLVMLSRALTTPMRRAAVLRR